MPEITIKQSTYERLESHAKPFIDTEDTVINRILDQVEMLDETLEKLRKYEEMYGISSDIKVIDPNSISDRKLKRTKILRAELSGQYFQFPNWNGLLKQMLILAMKDLNSIDMLRQVSSVNLVVGRRYRSGWTYIPQINITHKILNAPKACKALISLAQECGFGLDITIAKWREKKGKKFKIVVLPELEFDDDIPW